MRRWLLVLALGAGLTGCGGCDKPGDNKDGGGKVRKRLPSRRALGSGGFDDGGSKAGPWTAVFSPDGKYVLSSSGSWARVWDWRAGRIIPCPDVPWTREPAGGVRRAVFCPDGKRFLTGLADGQVQLWEFPSGRSLFSRREDTEQIVALAVSDDGKRALSGSKDGAVRLWELPAGKLLRSLRGGPGNLQSAALSPDGRFALSACTEDGDDATGYFFRLWDLGTGKVVRRFGGHRGHATAVAFSPDGRRALSAEVGSQFVRLWDVATGRLIGRFGEKGGRGEYVNTVAFSPDGRYAFAGCCGKEGLRCWEVASGREPLEFEDNPYDVWQVAVAPGGRMALSYSEGQHLILWDLTNGEEIRTLAGAPSSLPDISPVAFSPDGRLALSVGGGDPDVLEQKVNLARLEGRDFRSIPRGRVVLWDVHRREPQRVLRDKNVIYTASFVSGGRYVLTSASREAAAKLWDVQTGKQLRTVLEPGDKFLLMAVSPDERLVLAGGTKGRLALFDFATGKRLRDPSPSCPTASERCRVAGTLPANCGT